jgi:hypothetical protein
LPPQGDSYSWTPATAVKGESSFTSPSTVPKLVVERSGTFAPHAVLGEEAPWWPAQVHRPHLLRKKLGQNTRVVYEVRRQYRRSRVAMKFQQDEIARYGNGYASFSSVGARNTPKSRARILAPKTVFEIAFLPAWARLAFTSLRRPISTMQKTVT